MTPIPRYRPTRGPALFSAGFRPFFLGGAIWAAFAIPLWVAIYHGSAESGTALPPVTWHVHEMVFGYGGAVVAGFLLTAIPNWTGRLPLQGLGLFVLFATWAAGRLAMFFSEATGPALAAVIDLSFPLAFVAVVAREIVAGRNWRNLPMIVALGLLVYANALVQLQAVGWMGTADLGLRLGVATLAALIALVGGRIIPSFTANWLKRFAPLVPVPRPENDFDRVTVIVAAVALVRWTVAPYGVLSGAGLIAAGVLLAIRLARWRGLSTWKEPLLAILHIGYAWLAFGLILEGAVLIDAFMAPSAALHALTVGAIGTMTLAVMTRASLGHTGRVLTASPGITLAYALVNFAAVCRILSGVGALPGDVLLTVAGWAWSGAFCAFVVVYFGPLMRPRAAS